MAFVSKFQNIINQNYWHPETHKQTKIKYWVYKFIHLLISAIKSFDKDHIFLHVATLTYYSILTVVPIIAMGFVIAKGFGLEQYLYHILDDPKLQNREIWVKVIDFAKVWLERTKSGTVAFVGIVVLLYSILNMIHNIEYAFNHIWKQKTQRTLVRKITDYIAIVLLFPILLLISFGCAIYIQSLFARVSDDNMISREIGNLTVYVVKTFPFILISMVFTFLYMVITNKSIKFKSALYGGIFAGILFQLFQNFYIFYQVKLTSYNAVYGSFAAIPFFFIWMYYSWTIILLGAELAMHHESYSVTKNIEHHTQYSLYEEKLFSMLIIYEIIKEFKKPNNQPLTLEQIAYKLHQPLINISALIDKLLTTRLINEVKTSAEQKRYFQPAFSAEHYNLYHIAQTLEKMSPSIPNEKESPITSLTDEHQEIKNNFDHMFTAMQEKNARF